MRYGSIVAALAAAALACAPAAGQKISALPAATPLTGAEKMAAAQGAGCPTSSTPCATVAVTPAQIVTLASATLQPLDSDLTAIAGLSTTATGRDLLTAASAAAIRSKAGLGTLATQAAGGVAITGGSIDGTAIGGATAANGAFTGLSAAVVTVLGTNSGQLVLRPGNTLTTGFLEFIAPTGVRQGYLGFATTGAAIALVSENGAGFTVNGGPVTAPSHCYAAGVCDFAGSGTPEGSVTAVVGSTYRRTDGGAGTSFYVKQSGAGNTGWAAK